MKKKGENHFNKNKKAAHLANRFWSSSLHLLCNSVNNYNHVFLPTTLLPPLYFSRSIFLNNNLFIHFIPVFYSDWFFFHVNFFFKQKTFQQKKLSLIQTFLPQTHDNIYSNKSRRVSSLYFRLVSPDKCKTGARNKRGEFFARCCGNNVNSSKCKKAWLNFFNFFSLPTKPPPPTKNFSTQFYPG